jgi:hypothetical protein
LDGDKKDEGKKQAPKQAAGVGLRGKRSGPRLELGEVQCGDRREELHGVGVGLRGAFFMRRRLAVPMHTQHPSASGR